MVPVLLFRLCCHRADGLKLGKRKNGYFIVFPTGWVGLVTAFTLPLIYENSSQAGSKEFDEMFGRKCHPTVCI